MIVRKLRLQRGWSQEHLATLTDLNVRTIQRIERGQPASLESRKSLAAVFAVDLATFDSEPLETEANGTTIQPKTNEATMQSESIQPNLTQAEPIPTVSKDEKHAIQYVKGLKEFYSHAFMFVFFAGVIIVTKGIDDAHTLWLLLGWAVGVVIHGLVAYEKINVFTANWERRLVEKKLGKRL
ncbi:helix-turn-helix domain-containing protein [Arenicella xantha]|uniref:Helix-turn-helix protein n=1 Tax=Arenicella xantha TaxID=644221 RepID=A0A395JES8_9GAMM|nr:helix-turn-helix domain-containing protein [Arenicella xantha]RBP47113.1 helix-turn-helix protein [Arenicella xantha]